jgi:hypothetical protein
MADDDLNPTQPAANEENPFAQFVTPETKTYDQKTLLDRARDTFMAHFYKGPGVLGNSIASSQANITGWTGIEAEGFHLSDEDRQILRENDAMAMANHLRSVQYAENPVMVTPAQIAQIKNDLWPKANSVGTYAADVLGALAGAAASPEQWIFPETGAAGLAARMGAGRLVSGAIGTGASMGAMSLVTNPVEQWNEQKAGLRPMRGRAEPPAAGPSAPASAPRGSTSGTSLGRPF